MPEHKRPLWECDRSEFKKIPYIDSNVIGNRTVFLVPLWDGNHWHLWVPGPNGLVDMQPSEAVLGEYVAKSPPIPNDIIIPFVEFMYQRVSWPEVCPFIIGIIHDIYNFATSVAKIDHFFYHRDLIGQGRASQFAATELEYIFVLSRSVFDLLQGAIATIWKKHIKLIDHEAERQKRQLPDTFSKVVLIEKKHLRIDNDIATKYGLTPSLAKAYADVGGFFLGVRNFRDEVVHRGREPGIIFETEKGFCVNPNESVFRNFSIWNDSHRYNKNLVSLRPLIAHVVFHTIDACNRLVEGFSKEITLLPEISPGYHVFVRTYHNQALIQIKNIVEGGNPWWDSEHDKDPRG